MMRKRIGAVVVRGWNLGGIVDRVRGEILLGDGVEGWRFVVGGRVVSSPLAAVVSTCEGDLGFGGIPVIEGRERGGKRVLRKKVTASGSLSLLAMFCLVMTLGGAVEV